MLLGHPDGASIAAIHAGTAPDARVARLARHRDDVDAAFRGWNGAWLDPAFRRWDITGALARIAPPMLVVQGSADAYGTEAQPQAAVRLARGEVTVATIEGAGHAPHLERPDAVLPAVAGFMRSVLG